MRLLLLGATGLVGSRTLNLALSSEATSVVIAPTRTPLTPTGKLVNPVSASLEQLVPLLMSCRPDALICTLGTTQAKAGSKQAFRHVDYELPLLLGEAAHNAGVGTCAIVTAMGASASAMSLYYRTKGEIERDFRKIGFRSLTICRPSLIDGTRKERRGREQGALKTMRFLAPILPKKFWANPAEAIAAALLDAVITPRAGCRYICSADMAVA